VIPMMIKVRALLGSMALLALAGGPVLADSNTVRTEIRDELRGVSLYSIQISEEPVNSLTVIEGSFADSDRIALGLSAAVYDGAGGTEEYVFWLRHEGRRWLTTELSDPVIIEADDVPIDMELLRVPRPIIGPDNRFFEKFEFRFRDPEIKQLLEGGQVVVSFRSTTGVVQKTVSGQELESIRAFSDSLE